MKRPTLMLDADLNLWLQVDDDESDLQALYLGEPRDQLYDDLPPELWPQLDSILRDYRDSRAYWEQVRLDQESTYRRQQL